MKSVVSILVAKVTCEKKPLKKLYIYILKDFMQQIVSSRKLCIQNKRNSNSYKIFWLSPRCKGENACYRGDLCIFSKLTIIVYVSPLIIYYMSVAFF